ncbi:MAG: carbon storage regulator CsrA [bacterium]|nr:carbon storage regulator CsrA [bacterium]
MLVLSRKRREKILIGDTITITVIEIRGDKVRLGIDAPKEVRVVRSELLESDGAAPAAPSSKSE